MCLIHRQIIQQLEWSDLLFIPVKSTDQPVEKSVVNKAEEALKKAQERIAELEKEVSFQEFTILQLGQKLF